MYVYIYDKLIIRFLPAVHSFRVVLHSMQETWMKMLPLVSKRRQLTFQDTVGEFCFYIYLYVNVLVVWKSWINIYVCNFSFNMEVCIFSYIYIEILTIASNHWLFLFHVGGTDTLLLNDWKNIQVRVQNVTRTYWFKHMYICLCWVVFIYIYIYVCVCVSVYVIYIYIYQLSNWSI